MTSPIPGYNEAYIGYDVGQTRRAMYPEFFRLAFTQQAGDINFSANEHDDSGGPSDLDAEKLIAEKPLTQANSISSRVDNLRSEAFNPVGGLHKVVIDLDMDAALWETSTPGHHHLIINREMSWGEYSFLLTALKMVGLIQPGYWRACMARGASWIRTPWTRKGDQ